MRSVKKLYNVFLSKLLGVRSVSNVFLLALLCTVLILVILAGYTMWVKLGVCSMVVLVTVVLYQKNNKVNLYDI